MERLYPNYYPTVPVDSQDVVETNKIRIYIKVLTQAVQEQESGTKAQGKPCYFATMLDKNLH